MSTHYSSRWIVSLLVALTSACGGDSLAPGTPAQAYILARVANDPLPTVLQTTEHGTTRIIAQTIRFGPKGAGSISETTEVVPHAAGQPRLGPAEVTFGIHWVEKEGLLEIEFRCPFNADCVAGPHLIARVEGHAMRATWGPRMTGRTPLFYEEVPPPQ
jgi:hypothetical protein